MDTSLRATALEIVSVIPAVLADPPVQLVFNNFGDSSIDFTLSYWVDAAQVNLLAVQDAAVTQINAAFVARQIEIPYPIQTVLMGK